LSYRQLLQLFFHVTRAVAHMHAQSPPIAHRDLKLENVLLHRGSGMFKLCDFGSCTTRAQKYTNRREILDEEENIQRYSTDMYCAPEMCDLYTGQLVNEKVDVWALGCILYTLTYWKHPFQDEGKLGIVNAQVNYPRSKHPKDLENLIKFCLVLDPEQRPSCKQVVDEVKKLLKVLKSGGKAGPAGGNRAAAASGSGSDSDDVPAPRRTKKSQARQQASSNFADFGSQQSELQSKAASWATFGEAPAQQGNSSLDEYADFSPEPRGSPVEAASDSFGDFAATNDVGGDTNFGDFGESNENGHVGDDNFGDFGGFDAVEAVTNTFADFDAFAEPSGAGAADFAAFDAFGEVAGGGGGEEPADLLFDAPQANPGMPYGGGMQDQQPQMQSAAATMMGFQQGNYQQQGGFHPQQQQMHMQGGFQQQQQMPMRGGQMGYMNHNAGYMNQGMQQGMQQGIQQGMNQGGMMSPTSAPAHKSSHQKQNDIMSMF